jgi:perosamine synthetase
MKVPIAVPTFGQAERDAALRPLTSGWVAQGPEVAAFEAEFSALTGAAHSVTCTSGTSALHLALAALGVGPGDDVIVPGFTWVACANVVELLGARAVLCDIDPATFNVRVSDIEAAWTTRTKVVMPVHLFGGMAPIIEVAALCARRGVAVLEDAACGLGTTLGQTHAGTFGAAGTFSFHPRKLITAGEGGIVVTDDSALAQRMRSLRNHGAEGAMSDGSGMADFARPAWNYRLTDLQAAVLRAQLAQVGEFVARRQTIAARYDDAFANLPLRRQPTPPKSEHSFQSYVLRVEPRDELAAHLLERGVQTRQGTHAIHLLGAYRDRYAQRALPGCLDAHRHSLALPMYPSIEDAQLEHVIASVLAFFEDSQWR